MSTENSTAIYRPGINAILQRHEQMSAWLFFTIMAFLVMRFGVAPTSVNMDLRFDYDTNIYYLIGNGWMNGVMVKKSQALICSCLCKMALMPGR